MMASKEKTMAADDRKKPRYSPPVVMPLGDLAVGAVAVARCDLGNGAQVACNVGGLPSAACATGGSQV